MGGEAPLFEKNILALHRSLQEGETCSIDSFFVEYNVILMFL